MMLSVRGYTVLHGSIFGHTSCFSLSGKILAGEQPTLPWSDGYQLNTKTGRANQKAGTQNGSIMDSNFPR